MSLNFKSSNAVKGAATVSTIVSKLSLAIAIGFFFQVMDLSTAAAHSAHGEQGAKAEKTKELCVGFAPANTMEIPVGNRSNGRWSTLTGISEADFNEVIDRLEELYAPEIEKAGGKLSVNRLWKDKTVNASAQQSGSKWIVNMYGGLARHPRVTKDGFATVMCHEIGHHIGGAPKIAGWFGNDWATNEGGSDYWASLKCLRRYFENEDNEAAIALMDIDPLVKERCEAEHLTPADQSICIRSTAATMSVSLLLNDLSGGKIDPTWGTPDTKVVTKTNDNHPAAQCRLDTYFAGATCRVDKSIPVSQKDYKEGSCVAPNDSVGFRPTCWFFPPKESSLPKPSPTPHPNDGWPTTRL